VSPWDGPASGAATSAVDTGLRRHYVKLCDLHDFADPAVGARIHDIVPGLQPPEHLDRKNWEYAMLTLFPEDLGLLREDARILSVGAGHETVLFCLANRVAEVVATDIYDEGSFQAHEADVTMAVGCLLVLALPLPRVAPRCAAHGCEGARVPGRLVRRGVLSVIRRALRTPGGHTSLLGGDREDPPAGRRCVHRH
jgi:hypothetical protein